MSLNEYESSHKALVKNHIEELTKYVFPMSKIAPLEPHSQDSMDDEMVMALAEAVDMHFERGRWVSQDEKGGAVKIVEQYLPSCGSYDVDTVSNDEVSKRGPENISTALSYLCQLVNIISVYVGAYLPKHIKFSDFNDFNPKYDDSNEDFKRSARRLNANVVHLCVSQGVPQELIEPLQTAENILLLIKTGDLGGQGSFEFSPKLVKKLEKCGYIYDDDSDDECDYMLPTDWEALPPLPTVGDDLYLPAPTSFVPASTENQSLVSAAAASVLSIWKVLSHK